MLRVVDGLNDLVVVGSTGRHNVTTGSWEGGGKALLVRMDGELNVRETRSFGNDRLASATDVRMGTSQLLVTGVWDRIPNNHLPEEERWQRAFVATLPRANWSGLSLQPEEVTGLTPLRDIVP
ncbi:MAG: hypothetical protein ACT4TC_22265 [Myxococcaceae bacterium]